MHERDLSEMVHMDIEDGVLTLGYDDELEEELDRELFEEAAANCDGDCQSCHFANSKYCCFSE